MLFYTGGNRKDIGVEDNVVRIEVEFMDQQVITALADVLAPLQVICLALFIKGHHHDRGAVALAQASLGLEPLAGYELHDGTTIVQGNTAITEHAETWTWETGETVLLRFCSVQEVRDGKISRWWDYVDLSTIFNVAPASWVEHIMGGYK